MKRFVTHFISLSVTMLLVTASLQAQQSLTDSALYYQQEKTFVNPVLPGDHPDPTLLKVGNDFYHCGSSFHFTPYLPVYHSTDLVHWQVISRVLAPSEGPFVTDRPSAGIWQGAITYFYGSYWIYFSANGQWFCKASSPAGPWTKPVQVQTNPVTGPLGYDNSIFIDDDDKPYMVIKNGQKTNRIQAIGRDGQLTDTVINLDWVNANLQYSWAEGPVMCKRNGYYYYFPAGDVTGGQYVLRSPTLTADSTKWVRLGDFFKPITDGNAGLRRPNHIAAPIQLNDSTWWTIGQSYEKYGDDDWSGMGRQTSLYQVTWDGDRPWGAAPTTLPQLRPGLPPSSTLWRSAVSDDFSKETLSPAWHFLSKKDFASYTLATKKGWLTLTPDTSRTSIVQKETDHYYTAITRVDLDATDANAKAGLYLSSGNQKTVIRLYTGFNNGKQIVLQFDTAVRSLQNNYGNTVWLKVEKNGHWLTGYYSKDGRQWVALGEPVNTVGLDKTQPDFNAWVGTSVGLFAEGKPASFDCFIYKDGFSLLPAAGLRNYFGVEKVKEGSSISVTNTSALGGWFMLPGVETGSEGVTASGIEITASSATGGNLQVYLDGLNSQLIASITVPPTGGNNAWKAIAQKIKSISGTHDVFIKFPAGQAHNIYVNSIKFLRR
jgi:xylan 1,4-beta-xylosidase